MAGKDLASRLGRNRVTFQLPPATDDGAGGLEGEWSNYTSTPTVAAEVLPTGGREALIGGAPSGIQGFRVTVRYRDDVQTGHRMMWGSRALNIRSAEDPTGERRELVIFAETGTMV